MNFLRRKHKMLKKWRRSICMRITVNCRTVDISIKRSVAVEYWNHTAATVVFLANKVSMENVAKILGHKRTKITQRYVKVLDCSIKRDMENVVKAMNS